MKNWTKVISFTYPHEALSAKAFLEALGINVIIKDELTVQTYHFISNAIGGVKIFVENSNVDEALLLLENGGYIQKQPTQDDEKIQTFSSEYTHSCPYCKGTNVTRKNMVGYAFILSIILLGFPFPFLKRIYHCFDCLKEWKVKNS